MGSSPTYDSKGMAQGGGGQWAQYQSELDNDKPSEVHPYTAREMEYLEELFGLLDKKNVKSLDVKDFQEIPFLRGHALFPRIREMFEQEMRKIKAKRINFQLFLFLLEPFHVRSEIEAKYKYVFRLYDCDKNQKIDGSDLAKIYKMIYTESWMQEEDYSKLVTETLIRFGSKGEIRQENLRELLPEGEVYQFMSFRFDGKEA